MMIRRRNPTGHTVGLDLFGQLSNLSSFFAVVAAKLWRATRWIIGDESVTGSESFETRDEMAEQYVVEELIGQRSGRGSQK